MSLIINSIVSGIKAFVVMVIEEAPKVIKALKEKVQEVRMLLETDGQHDRRIRELNRRELKQARREQRMERRHGAPKAKSQHPEQVRWMEATELKYARAFDAYRACLAHPSDINAAAFWAVAK